MRSLFVALILTTASFTSADALTGGRADVNTAAANATVNYNGGCTGTLIAPTLVLTAGHCGGMPTIPGAAEVDGTFVPMGQWVRMTSPASVRIGADMSSVDADHTFQAVFASQAGWADIIMLKLDRPVPREIAVPVVPLTRLAPARSAPGFWDTQSFTVAGYAGGNIRNIATQRRGAFPCKTIADMIGEDEFFCALDLNGASLEAGDSGGPLYWYDTASRRTYLVGVYQGWHDLRTCPDAIRTELGCGGANTFNRLVARADGCRAPSATMVSVSTWSVHHHTAVFAQGNNCYVDSAGVARRQPNISAWIDSAMRWEPTATESMISIVLQRTPSGAFALDHYTGDEFSRTLGQGLVFNANAPALWPANVVPLWGWQAAGGQFVYTTQFPGHFFSQPETSNRVRLSRPRLIGYIYDPAQPQPRGSRTLVTYRNTSTNRLVTTWSLDLVADDATRAQWVQMRVEGYMPDLRLDPRVLRPITPIRPRT